MTTTETTPDAAAERVAALRAARSGGSAAAAAGSRPAHAQAAKILTAGVSTSLVLGIVAYMGHAAQVEAARERARVDAARQFDLAQAAPAAVGTPSTVAAVPAPVVIGSPAPVTPAPVPAQPQVVSLQVPVPVPVAQPAPQQAAPAAAPSASTKSSG